MKVEVVAVVLLVLNIYVCKAVNGKWSSWSYLNTCTVSCGYGTRTRTRSCNDPPPSGGGLICQGLSSESENCNEFPCQINGEWSSWSYLHTCTVTCGYGTRTKTRSCNNPPPSGGGLNCRGVSFESESCYEFPCPVNGGWSTWSYLDNCSVTCGFGTRTKARSCNNPPPPGSGLICLGLSSKSESCNSFPCLESGENESGNIHVPLVVGTVSGVIIIVLAILTLVLYAKRRWYNSKRELDYEKTDITRVKSHTYEETHVNPMYQNDQQGAEIETYFDEANLVERYDMSDLIKQFRNKDYLLRKLRAEFKLLNNSTGDPKLYNSEYEIVVTRRNKDENKLYLKSSTLDVLQNNNVSIVLEIPNNNLAEQFWTLIDDHSIENIILLVKENEKVHEFYPTLDDIVRMNNFEISLDSAERMHKIIMMLTFNLQNKTKQTIRNIKIFKTNVSEVPTVQAMCYILDKASEMRDAPVAVINSEMADLSVCGVLTVCLNVMFAIKNQSPFSVLENALILYKQDRRFFKNVDDYELCYKVIGNYLEAVNTYDCID